MIKTYNELELFHTDVINNSKELNALLRKSQELRKYAINLEVMQAIDDWKNGTNRPDDYLDADGDPKTEIPLPNTKADLLNYNAMLIELETFMQAQTNGIVREVILANMSRQPIS